jgi:hypothetical protein
MAFTRGYYWWDFKTPKSNSFIIEWTPLPLSLSLNGEEMEGVKSVL